MLTGLREDSPARRRWDMCSLVLAIVSMVLVSFQFAFQHRVGLVGSLIVYAIDTFFVIDIVFNFRTTYRRIGAEVTDPGMIARRYRRGLFPIDLLAALPLDILLLPWKDALIGGISIVLFVRLLRLLRVARLTSIIRAWGRRISVNAGYIRIGKLVLGVTLALHLLACVWFLEPFLNDYPEESWVVSESLVGAGAGTQYIRSLYWVVVTATSVGYGDITPHGNVEYILSMIVIVIGASMWAFIIGNLASLLSSLDAAKTAFWTRVELVTQFLRGRGVPPEVNENVRGYYEYAWGRYRGTDELNLLADLPPQLRLEVLLHLAAEVMKRVPLFRYCSEVLRDDLLLSLRPTVITPGGFVVREGELADGLYFIARGTVEVISDDGRTAHGTLEEGDYFGDLSLLLGERRTASARATGYCELLVLPRTEFERIKLDYPEFRDALKSLSSERSEKISALVLSGAVL